MYLAIRKYTFFVVNCLSSHNDNESAYVKRFVWFCSRIWLWTFFSLQDAGQHNLSIALRHLLQQIVDSTTPTGHKHTDMSLPHDGYIQKLSWYFECEKCNYKAFYSHDMEDHKQACMAGLSSTYPAGKKRKLVPPKRVTSSTHPPNTGLFDSNGISMHLCSGRESIIVSVCLTNILLCENTQTSPH